jgi:hypothetical protein
MKVLFKNMVAGFTGKADESVIYYSRRLNRCFVRRRPIFKDHPGHPPFAAIMQNIANIKPSALYKRDLSWYLELYNQLKQNKFTPVHSWNNLYLKMLFKMRDSLEDINLATITRTEIYERDLPCISLRRAIEAGLLPKVKNYEVYVNEI